LFGAVRGGGGPVKTIKERQGIERDGSTLENTVKKVKGGRIDDGLGGAHIRLWEPGG